MPIDITMPKLGLTMETGTIERWLKASGEAISEGDPIVEVASDKINFEVESPASGTVLAIVGKEGEEFACGAVIGTIAVPGEAANASGPVEALSPNIPAVAPSLVAAVSTVLPITTISRDGTRFIASPAARRLAREFGLPVAEVIGTGPHGRVTLSDVRAFRSARERTPAPGPVSLPAVSLPSVSLPSVSLPSVSLPSDLDSSRRAIYRKMTEVGMLPLATVETVARVDAVKALLERRRDFGWTAYAVYACGRLLREGHELRIDARSGKPFETIDIGVAADTPRGLIVPVVRHADARPLAEIHAEIVRLAGVAREGTISGKDIGGACFSVSNVGPQKVERVAPLVDPPQTAILGIGAVTQRPAVVGDAVIAAWMLTCVLTFDHRFVDGAPAARFLAKLVRAFGEPEMLL